MLVVLAVSLIACRPAASPTARETVRGAVLGVANAMQYATLVCARIVVSLEDAGENAKAQGLYDTCERNWEAARASLNAADKLVDTWQAGSEGKIVCLAQQALDSLASTMTALRKLNVDMPEDIRVTIDDGIRLAQWLIRLAPGGGAACVVPEPAPKKAAPSAPAPGMSL